MENYDIYKDIVSRTDGDIYIGVVGPVRTGKSTFIKRFMETVVIPNIDNEYKKERAIDELPQSAAGRTIMTTEPKFIPNEAIEIVLDNNVKLKTRLVDCVGYLVKNSLGYLEEDMPRMVKTPWEDEEVPFEKAAEIGTRKVIAEHSTVGIVITTDGTITELPREDYIVPEERVILELKELNKPFIVLVNSREPDSDRAKCVANEIAEKYNVSCMTISCENIVRDDINNIFSRILFEFMIERVNLKFPRWISGLKCDSELKQSLITAAMESFQDARRLRDINLENIKLSQIEEVKKVEIEEIDLARGIVSINVELKESLFYSTLSDVTGMCVRNEGELFSIISEFSKVKREYDKLAYALHEVETKGYGIVSPGIEDLILEEPEIVRQGQKFGVKLKATAPSIHMIKINTETEVSPIVGSEKQSEDLVRYLLSEFEENPKKIWESNIFGKSLHEVVNEGLQNKLAKMPEEAQMKLQDTLQRIVNEGTGGLICILL